ncbi:phosphoglycerate mutase-like protein [Schizopora paradoxa]|uniref:Phosphoglycerate mutase-like protein n=1 Tax=Schizopora paradoxa TaxID=27342 RepID=A0A0H2RWJ5_9AGAM|nr:phosphoglycerate mutase-like protein [Schizopora paradoxa]
MITVTFVRHGESMDNLRAVWAGWADAPLSNHGMNQAEACGAYFATTGTRFTHIYASPLKRAFSTAQAILDAQPEPKPELTVSLDVREQHFGVAEGKPWSYRVSEVDKDLPRDQLYERGVFPILYNREDGFPGGESLNDLQVRAERAIKDIVLPYVKDGQEDIHIAIVSHGLCISELVSALVRLDHFKTSNSDWTGLLNTAWTRVTLDTAASSSPLKILSRITQIYKQAKGDSGSNIPLKVRVTHVNEHSHLQNIKRQGGGIGSSAHDPAQKDIRAFFGGAKPTTAKDEAVHTADAIDLTKDDAELEEGRATSNAYDEVGVVIEKKEP